MQAKQSSTQQMERLPNRYPKISQSHKVPLYKGLSLFYPKLLKNHWNSNKNKQIYFVRLRMISLLNKIALIRNETDNHWKPDKDKKRGHFRPSLCSFESYDNLFDSENLLKELLYAAFSLLFLHVSSILVRCIRTIFSLWAIAFFVISFYICAAFLMLLLF